MYLTRNVISLSTQADEEETAAVSKAPDNYPLAGTETDAEEDLQLAQASEEDNISVITQTSESETMLGT